MSKDLSLDTIMCLQNELEEALETYDMYCCIGDFRLAEMWLKIIEQIRNDIRRL